MDADERKIRELLDRWWQATKADDVDTVLELMADDVVFLTPGAEPFGKEAFAAASRDRAMEIDGGTEIEEIVVNGDWAWMRTRLDMTITPANGDPLRRAGSTLTILRRQPDGRWVIARDANLLSP